MAKAASKERKRHGRRGTVGDRISSLPDSMLHNILSFLPTDQVVATSLLSKRWKSLWLKMSTFDFEDERFASLDDFFQFVDAVLFFADSKPIEKFRARFSFLHNRSRVIKINIWINTLIYRRVQHLELCSYVSSIEVTSRIFNSDTLRVLKLNKVRVMNSFHSVNLPSLKVMHLVEVELPDYESVVNLLSGCPLLEELILDPRIDNEDEDEEEEKDFTVNIEKLEHLVSAAVPSFLISSEALTNVAFLRLNGDESPVRDMPVYDNLTHLEISRVNNEHLNWIMGCLRSCPKLEILVIYEIYVDPDVEEELMEPTQDVPQCLSSHLREFTLTKYKGWECEFEVARYIMENARVLRSISIFCCSHMDEKDKYEYLEELAFCPRVSEHCRLSFK
ncbi:F-box/FBD/LRR-repeat protein At4g26340-like [Neltuma alba]|uniref:F-box/FBD/LRR-repeat protein At4g26340-like n=1 Tax=Neltuma alba TaxID=207710 RepID=UPI0010A5631A|nr:F-box/FBD/LRR-repeat protein At4g26340-like [Prosopis alba]